MWCILPIILYLHNLYLFDQHELDLVVNVLITFYKSTFIDVVFVHALHLLLHYLNSDVVTGDKIWLAYTHFGASHILSTTRTYLFLHFPTPHPHRTSSITASGAGFCLLFVRPVDFLLSSTNSLLVMEKQFEGTCFVPYHRLKMWKQYVKPKCISR